MVFLDKLEKDKLKLEKLDMYLAQIACEVRRTLVKDPNKVILQSFIFDFDKMEKDEAKELDIEERTKKAKDFFFALTKHSGV